MQPLRRFGFDAAILFSDILVVPDALGQKVWFETGEGPRLKPITRIDALPTVDDASFLRHLDSPLETLGRLRRMLDPQIAVIGFCGAPWTVASYMVGGRGTPDLAPIRNLAASDGPALSGIIDRLVDVSVTYLSAQASAGADVLQIFESWAQVLRGAAFEQWSLGPVRRIVEGVKARHPDIPIIVFPRKAGDGYVDMARLPGVAGISVDSDIDLEWAAERLQPFAAIQGNVDPAALVEGPTAIDRAVDRLFATVGQGPWIANLGHGIVPQTPTGHVAHLIRRIRERSDRDGL